MCLGNEEGGYRAVLSCDACQGGFFLSFQLLIVMDSKLLLMYINYSLTIHQGRITPSLISQRASGKRDLSVN